MSSTLHPTAFDAGLPTSDDAEALAERVRAAAELLESIADDRALLAELPDDDRRRLLQAAGQVSRPDAIVRRQLVKETKREEGAARRSAPRPCSQTTGIRKLRREPVFTTPNCFPPADVRAGRRIDGGAEAAEAPAVHAAGEPQNCYVCKQDYTAIHHFYDQLCPACAAFNFAKRTRARRPARARRAAHRRAREDRLPGRASSCCAPART